MESSRKIILCALALLFASQFFGYTPDGHTSTTVYVDQSFTLGGLPYNGQIGWDLHKWWLLMPLLLFFAYRFNGFSQKMIMYILCLLVITISGLGSGTGAIMGEIAILIAGYAIYVKRKEHLKKTNA